MISNEWRIIGIDISDKAIDFARLHAKKNNLNADYLVMDAEKTIFDANSFDIIFNYGTFSSLNMDKAWTELNRILKPGGMIIGIETQGNNPLFNLKRKINILIGKRTKWAANHILKFDDFVKIDSQFRIIKAKSFSLFTMFLYPLTFFVPERHFNKILHSFEKLDRLILNKFNFYKFGFKLVFVLQKR